MIELSEEQRRELSHSTPFAIDARTPEEYVLVPKSVIGNPDKIVEDDSLRMYPMLADLDPEDWEDAAVYDGQP